MLSPLSIEILILWSNSFCFATKKSEKSFFMFHNWEACAVILQLIVTMIIVKGKSVLYMYGQVTEYVVNVWAKVKMSYSLKTKEKCVLGSLKHIYFTLSNAHYNAERIIAPLCTGNLNLRRASNFCAGDCSPRCCTCLTVTLAWLPGLYWRRLFSAEVQ